MRSPLAYGCIHDTKIVWTFKFHLPTIVKPAPFICLAHCKKSQLSHKSLVVFLTVSFDHCINSQVYIFCFAPAYAVFMFLAVGIRNTVVELLHCFMQYQSQLLPVLLHSSMEQIHMSLWVSGFHYPAK